MGRADLVRYRETSHVLPAPLPHLARGILQQARNIYERGVAAEDDEGLLKAAELIVSLETASSQRMQTAIIKLLGVTVSKLHPRGRIQKIKKKESRTEAKEYKQKTSNGHHDCSKTCCRLCFPLLVTLLTQSDDFSSGIQGAALRALLRCNYYDVEVIMEALSKVKENLSAFETGCKATTDAISLIRLSRILISEPESRIWVTNEGVRSGAMNLAAIVSGELLKFFTNAENDESEMQKALASLSKTSINSICECTMKVAQELCQCGDTSFLPDFLQAATLAADNGYALLKTDVLPRAYIMGVSMAFVVIRSAAARQNGNVHTEMRELLSSLQRHEQAAEIPPYARLCMLRALLETPTLREHTQKLIFDGQDSLFDQLQSLCTSNLDGHLRFAAFDVIIGCVRRSVSFPCSCRERLIDLMYQRWEEAFPGVPVQMRRVIEAAIVKEKEVRPTSDCWTTLAKSLVQVSWTRKGKYSPLSVLVQHVKTDELFDACHDLQLKALSAISLESDLSKPVADFLEPLWRKLAKEKGIDRACERAAGAFRTAIGLPSNTQLRRRIGDHVFPAYFRVFSKAKGSVNILLEASKASGLDEKHRASLTVTAISAARRLGLFSGSLRDPSLVHEIRQSIRSVNPTMRLAAFELVATCHVTTEPMLEEELSLILESLPIFFFPGALPGDLSRFKQLMRRFLERFADSFSAAKTAGGWWTRERKQKCDGYRSQGFEERRLSYIRLCGRFLRDVCRVVFASCYPGTPMTRRTTALAVLRLLGNLFGFENGILDLLGETPATLSTLLECMTDNWESSRSAAWVVASELSNVANVWCSPQFCEAILRHAEPLLYSAKQREADTGAMLVRWVFHRAVATNTAFTLTVPTSKQGMSLPSTGLVTEQASYSVDPPLRFVISIVDMLLKLTIEGEGDLPQACLHGLVHGPALVLRLILMDLDWSSYEPGSVSHLLENLISVAARSIKVAMEGICFQEPNINALQSKPNVSPDEYCDEIFMHDERQKLVTSCFLSIKELCSLLGLLCHRCPISRADDMSKNSGMLTLKQIVKIGDLLDDVLRHTRHNGVIDKAAQAVQLMSTRLLSLQDPEYNRIPISRIKLIIESATSNGLYVLRRSAGAPAYIVAVIRAEVSVRRCSKTNILSYVMMQIFDHLRHPEAGLSGKKSDEAALSHCFNILRSLFLDGDVAEEVPPYFAATTELTVLAFSHASWFVRNSALMVFSALIRRALGVQQKSSTRTRARAKGVSAPAFFRRYPRLHGFLLRSLKSARKEGNMTDRHFGLYPILHLLAKLGPGSVGEGGAPSAEQVYLGDFENEVSACLSNRNAYIRNECAEASEAVAQVSGRKAVTVTCLDQLLGFTFKEMMKNQNLLHGLLLRLNVMMRNATAEDIEASRNGLMRCGALAGPPNPCPLTRAHCVRLFCRMMELDCELSSSELTFMTGVAESALFPKGPHRQQSQIGNSLLIKYATELFLSTIIHRLRQSTLGVENVCDLYSKLLRHSSYECRLVTIRWTRGLIDEISEPHAAFRMKSNILTLVLSDEPNHEVLKETLLVIADIRGDAEEDSFFWAVVQIAEKHRSLEVRAAAVELMGALLSNCPNPDREVSYLKVVQDASSESNMTVLRTGAAKSLDRARLENLSSKNVSELYLIFLSLLQDDDRDVRDLAARAYCGNSSTLHPLFAMDKIFSQLADSTNTEPVVIDYLERCTFLPGVLHYVLGMSPVVLSELIILSDVDATNANGKEDTASEKEKVSDKMFEVERDNLHTEVLVTLQLGVRALHEISRLQKLPRSLSVDYLEKQVRGVVKLLPASDSSAFDITAYLKDADHKFLSIYKALLRVAGTLPLVKGEDTKIIASAMFLQNAVEKTQELHPTLHWCTQDVIALMKGEKKLFETDLLFLLPKVAERAG